ncbi:hypothetical protein CsSME_00025321 [Camellia sinensis var. sinensis]
MDPGPSQRRSVTASNRRLCELENAECGCGRGHGRTRVHDDDTHIAMDDDPIHDAPVIDDIAMDDDPTGDDADIVDKDILTQPFLRGPTNPSIFKSFKSYVAATIWNGADEKGPLKYHNHSSKIHLWLWWEYGNNATFVNIVEISRLAHLAHCTYRFVNKIVVSSFIKRWQLETNTFHLTIGEMTITLDDVATILGFPIVGKSISVRKLSEKWAIALVVNTLKIDDDKTGTKVPVVYLSLLFNLTIVSSYAWGAVALAYLYRQMGYSNRSGGWIYEHFRGFQPHLNVNYTRDMSHVYRWTSRRESGEETQLQAFREKLDRLVIWDQYQSCRDVHPCHPVTFYHGCLKCLEVVEPYHPDRVLRQFGRV